MIESIVVREPSEQEFLDLARFSYENFILGMAKSSGQSAEELRKQMGGPPILRSEADHWLMVTQNNKKVGFVWFQLNNDNKSAFGMDIFLEPEFRNQGIGRHVLNLCAQRLAELGIKTAKICVFEDNAIARSLYKSLGFETESFDEARRQFTLSMDLKV
ncbi:hypothetical protein AZI86_05475 [Bdellovibrio bacteriovorus]|uniref:N-acetyltransferase domain-containing protein n=1 Tax=Bdellovibrio bacteriovorus TaxID=959 RepID=A0A150WQ30_BDEBC|nr:GNAT family N-acetyltransferase [Bdellovibrio bacteriovorus]KYG66498.1 hypothetical protein AZI86_05475 [Bdellovibrio bacteriovorus]